ncbi:MAG: amidohydrolase family protein [Novosphingobium sp.]|nr:amidohydrolase family protein [Novosphingobium sp.]
MLDLVIKRGRIVDGTGAQERTADIAVKQGRIAEIGSISEPAHRTIDADGLIVTPGWIDVHTHYDAQVTWDPWLDASFVSGVTTAIFGNCGVGLAPVRPQDHALLIEFMEGVEEISADALRAGLKWNWESFSDYLDALEPMERSFDVGALVPHGPLRLWAMGERVQTEKCAKGEELGAMRDELARALEAGAFGMATSRTPLHRSLAGAATPDCFVEEDELLALAEVIEAQGAYLQMVPNGSIGENPEELRREMALLERIVDETGVDVHLLSFQPDNDPDYYREQIAIMDRLNTKVSATTQFAGRSPGALLNFLSANPFMHTPTFERIASSLPVEQWLEELARPEVKASILAEENRPDTLGSMLSGALDRVFDLGDELNYEPDLDQCLARRAEREGLEMREFTYDALLATGDTPRIWATFVNYAKGSLDAVGEALGYDSAIVAASDAGAHMLTVVDASMNSFMLSHWVRDRKRGPRMALEQVVHLMTQKPARSIGLQDRGVLAPGLKADINVIDLDALKIHLPHFESDLPAGARRLMQDVTGYRATIVSGEVTRENDKATGALPGRLVRRA